MMKEAATMVRKSGNVKELFLKAGKLYKNANLNDQAKFLLIREDIKYN